MRKTKLRGLCKVGWQFLMTAAAPCLMEEAAGASISTEFYDEAIRPKLGPIGALLHYEVDRQRQEVRTSLAGLVHSRAIDCLRVATFGCRRQLGSGSMS